MVANYHQVISSNTVRTENFSKSSLCVSLELLLGFFNGLVAPKPNILFEEGHFYWWRRAGFQCMYHATGEGGRQESSTCGIVGPNPLRDTGTKTFFLKKYENVFDMFSVTFGQYAI